MRCNRCATTISVGTLPTFNPSGIAHLVREGTIGTEYKGVIKQTRTAFNTSTVSGVSGKPLFAASSWSNARSAFTSKRPRTGQGNWLWLNTTLCTVLNSTAIGSYSAINTLDTTDVRVRDSEGNLTIHIQFSHLANSGPVANFA